MLAYARTQRNPADRCRCDLHSLRLLRMCIDYFFLPKQQIDAICNQELELNRSLFTKSWQVLKPQKFSPALPKSRSLKEQLANLLYFTTYQSRRT